ncbi:DUF3604 domain-containing protein [Shewanella corallii]|uniref:DUF3604 domain-containing protein n=1 Tax=Shewanella corallii TaxID=560080 RepID=A0ABT0NAN1_9GAMM|nr:DUF3604 domain-containing protein [Shewanella corallii]MCL2915523.1 DUF3604 domain-containing protein [Shewanella corallii]
MTLIHLRLLVMILAGLLYPAHASQKQLLWGDTHTHSSYSFDAFLSDNRTADPDTAYRFARGEPVLHPLHKWRVQLSRPLDFLVVADHAEGLGVMEIYYSGRHPVELTEDIRELREAVDSGEGQTFFTRVLPLIFPSADFVTDNPVELKGYDNVVRLAWHDLVDAADRHNRPGEFTTFVGWEWSAYEGGGNLHRVVFSPINASEAKTFMPFGADKSNDPRDLWRFLEQLNKSRGYDFIAIPHNSNVSRNRMFPPLVTDIPGNKSLWAQMRYRWEPVVEITQYKGDSETHPNLSPEDEFADFSPFPFLISSVVPEPYSPDRGDFVRSGLLSGLKLRQALGTNPYEFGVIGSTDSHTGLSTAEEDEFAGKMAMDGIPESKAMMYSEDSFNGWDMSAAGMAAVWAEANTRDAIFDAFKRREVYGTTGPRISLKLYAGWELTQGDLTAVLDQKPPLGSVPMGGILTMPKGKASAPSLIISAVKDPLNANLDRVQVIKGWVDEEGKARERVYNVAWDRDRRELDEDGKLEAVGNTVSMTTGRADNSIGSAELSVLWRDPDFRSNEDAFYYVRVLQIPTIHHSWLDARALGKTAIEGQPKTIQERAYSSPVWYYAPR